MQDVSDQMYKRYADQVKHFEVDLYELPRRFLAPHEMRELAPLRIKVEATVIVLKSNCKTGRRGEIKEVEVHQLGMKGPVDTSGKGGSQKALRAAIRRVYSQENLKVIIPTEALAA